MEKFSSGLALLQCIGSALLHLRIARQRGSCIHHAAVAECLI
ncbi:hypothetical protein [Thermaurantimonas sp.]